MKSLQTQYAGYLFRSRLEARWAKYFNLMGIQFNYEPLGVQLESGKKYLPDFFLPSLNIFVECKGILTSNYDIERVYDFGIESKKGVLIAQGDPDNIDYTIIFPENNKIITKTVSIDFEGNEFREFTGDIGSLSESSLNSAKSDRFGIFD